MSNFAFGCVCCAVLAFIVGPVVVAVFAGFALVLAAVAQAKKAASK